jgi:hypothetical protein
MCVCVCVCCYNRCHDNAVKGFWALWDNTDGCKSFLAVHLISVRCSVGHHLLLLIGCWVL